jgi:hypothetical protein
MEISSWQYLLFDFERVSSRLETKSIPNISWLAEADTFAGEIRLQGEFAAQNDKAPPGRGFVFIKR